MKDVKIGTLWSTADGKVFKVTSVARTQDETWITYQSIGDKKSYSCLLPAFVNRFKPWNNPSY